MPIWVGSPKKTNMCLADCQDNEHLFTPSFCGLRPRTATCQALLNKVASIYYSNALSIKYFAWRDRTFSQDKLRRNGTHTPAMLCHHGGEVFSVAKSVISFQVKCPTARLEAINIFGFEQVHLYIKQFALLNWMSRQVIFYEHGLSTLAHWLYLFSDALRLNPNITRNHLQCYRLKLSYL